MFPVEASAKLMFERAMEGRGGGPVKRSSLAENTEIRAQKGHLEPISGWPHGGVGLNQIARGITGQVSDPYTSIV